MICVHRPCVELKKAPQSDGEPDVLFPPFTAPQRRVPPAQSRSKIVAIPCPPPMHIVTSA